ncbi:MAG: hypothetical protein LV471_09260 [Nitrosomonas sp.]|nr:hypothetical protein [Nitrosomonas sp.]
MTKLLYLISQDADDNYDNYTAAVVCAESEDEAKKIHPDGRSQFPDWSYNDNWAKSPDMVNVKYLGIADESINIGVVLHSYKG